MSEVSKTLYETAMLHLDCGHSLIPVSREKRPHSAALIATGHKKLDENGVIRGSWLKLKEERPEPAVVQEWLKFSGIGLGMVTGAISSVIVIDGDLGGGITKFEQWGVLNRCHVRSISGGVHYYVRAPNWKVKTVQSHTGTAYALIKGVDIRADGGYAIIPPSAFPAGRYTALRPFCELGNAIDFIPEEVLRVIGLLHPPKHEEVLPRQAAPRLSSAQQISLKDILLKRALEKAFDGHSREGEGFSLSLQLRDNGFSMEEARLVLWEYQSLAPKRSAKGINDPYTTGQALTSLQQAFSRPARSAWKFAEKQYPKETCLATQMIQSWHKFDTAGQIQAARCVAGMPPTDIRRKAMEFLATTTVEINSIEKRVAELKEQGYAVSGTAALAKLINQAKSGKP